MIRDHAINSGTKLVHSDVHTVTKAGEKAMKDSDDQKKNKYKRTYRVLEKYASSKLRDNNMAYPELNEIYVKLAKSTMVNLKL